MVRAETSNKNEYWISKHRYYELKHFCMQYEYWKLMLRHLEDGALRTTSVIDISDKQHTSTTTTVESAAIRRDLYLRNIAMVDESAREADEVLSSYILEGVLKGKSYDELNALYFLPCGKEYYYKKYRKFFWILNGKRL